MSASVLYGRSAVEGQFTFRADMLPKFNSYCEPTFVIRDFVFDSLTKRSFGDCYVVSELI